MVSIRLLLSLMLTKGTLSKTRRATCLRIGVAGPPGAGKSTFIEALGKYLIKEKNMVRQCLNMPR
jgi:putative protein kinase ArgK-like GTPase of G3E family